MTDDAIPAATLVVMREVADGPPELLMVRRTQRMVFAAGAMVFPGGRVDQDDVALGGNDEDAARVAAIRETIEETSLPIAVSSVPPTGLQQALHAGEPFARLLERHKLTLTLDALVPFARWRPAFHQPRRFDTLFFLARAPDGDLPLSPQEGECEAAEWLSAAETLRRIAAGEATAIFPTIRNLERLAQFGSHAEAVAHARSYPIETISPWVEEIAGEKWLRIPDHLGYPVTAERLTSAIRA